MPLRRYFGLWFFLSQIDLVLYSVSPFVRDSHNPSAAEGTTPATLSWRKAAPLSEEVVDSRHACYICSGNLSSKYILELNLPQLDLELVPEWITSIFIRVRLQDYR